MSRHREIRKIDLDDYEDDDYGSSYPESICELSTSMEKEFIYERSGKSPKMTEFLNPGEWGVECEEDSSNLSPPLPLLSPEDNERMGEALEEILDVLGLDSIPESRIKDQIWKCDFDSSLALNTLLNNPPTFHSEAARRRRVSPLTPAPLPATTTKAESLAPKALPMRRMPIAEEEAAAPLPFKNLNARTPNSPISACNAPPMRKNNIDVLSSFKSQGSRKDSLNLIVAGHVDSGKSTIVGHFLHNMGEVSSKTLHKYEIESKKSGKSSFSYAWVLDETSEERSRGITINCGSVQFSTNSKTIHILDAPGHKDFIPNMISGTYQADAAILVINSNTGEFEVGLDSGGQTREHGLLLRSLGINPIIIAINKLDTVGWSEKRFEEIRSKMNIFLKQIGYKNQDITYIPISGLTGDNLTEPSTHLIYWKTKFKTLLHCIDDLNPPERLLQKPFRMSVSDVFKAEQSSGISISGQIVSGFVLKDDKILVCPSGELGTVKNIAKSGFAGDFVSINISGLSDQLSPGMILSDPQFPVPSSKALRARIVVFDSPIPLIKGSAMVLHCGNIYVQASLAKLVSLLNKSNGQVIKKKPRCLPKNSNAVVEIQTETAVGLELYSDYRDLGRFMLRCDGRTLAAGIVTQIL
uniref:Cell wall protein AWA1like [Aplysia californica] n=1 Tax=Lepeophtheirus salmonis TaxID=72036 RepID=A0A0K2TG84_LEPSM